MSKKNNFITFIEASEHVLEHDLAHKPFYSPPKIYNAKGDLSKRWYVYFSYRNPETGKLERMKNIYGKANLFKTKEDRLSILISYRKNLFRLLKQGYNPHVDNTELFQNRKTTKTHQSAPKNEVMTPPKIEVTKNETPTEKKWGIKEAFEFALALKFKEVGVRTYNDYQYRSNAFLKWLKINYPEVKTIDQLEKKLIVRFLNDMLIKTSARSRNNYRLDLSTLLQTLENNEMITTNFIKNIPTLKSTPKRNKTYTKEVQESIFKYLKEKDPILLLYIQFISYNFLRPIEVCRLKIKDINLVDNTLQFKAKNSPLKTKIIPEILLSELPDLTGMDPEAYVFTPEAIGGHWNAAENNRRDHFSKRFNTQVKEPFKLDKNQGLYSFRHTYITKLYRAMLKTSTPFAAKSNLMLITGHSSMVALEKYLRDMDVELPKDYSALLK